MSSKKRPAPPRAVPGRAAATKAPRPTKANAGLPEWLFPALLAVATGLCFAQSIGYDFVNFDDDALIYENPMVRNGDFKRVWGAQLGTADYKPVTYLIWIFLWKIGGGSAAYFHALNVILHMANAVLAFVLFRRVARSGGLDSEAAKWVGFGTALLFALHPFRVESVVWAVELKDVLYGFFYLSGLLACWNAIAGNKNRWLWWAVGIGLFPLALFSKSMGITYPLALTLIWFAQRGGAAKLHEALGKWLSQPWAWALAALVAIAVFTGVLMKADNELGDPYRWTEALQALPEAYRAFLVVSFRLIVWPVRIFLCWPESVYYAPKAWLGALGPVVHLLPLMVMGAIYGLRLWANKVPFLGWGVAWTVCCMLPALAAPADADNFLSDRYMYIASLGIFLPVAAGLVRMGNNGKTLLCLIGLILGALAFAQTPVWKNGETLFTDAIKKTPAVANGWQNRGHARMTRALATTGPQQAQLFNEALADFNQTLSIRSDIDLTRLNRGNVYFQLNRMDEAMADFNYVISDTASRSRVIPANLARAYSYRGAVHARRSQYEAALSDLTKAIEIERYSPDALRNRGSVLLMMGRYEESIQAYQDFLNFEPNNAQVLYLRSGANVELGRYNDALYDLQRARALNPPNIRDIDERIRLVNQKISGAQ